MSVCSPLFAVILTLSEANGEESQHFAHRAADVPGGPKQQPVTLIPCHRDDQCLVIMMEKKWN